MSAGRGWGKLYDVDVTRRSLLGTAVAGGSGLAAASVLSARAHAASFGNPDEPPQGAVNAKNPASLTDPGPHSAATADQFPAASSAASGPREVALENVAIVQRYCRERLGWNGEILGQNIRRGEPIGRDEELTELLSLAVAHRLVTLTGAGGIGKTRLALAAARRLPPKFADGVWVAELAPLADPALVRVAMLKVAATIAGGVCDNQSDKETSSNQGLRNTSRNCSSVSLIS